MPTGAGHTTPWSRGIEDTQEPMHTILGVPGLRGHPDICRFASAPISGGLGGTVQGFVGSSFIRGGGGESLGMWSMESQSEQPLFKRRPLWLCSHGARAAWLRDHSSWNNNSRGGGCCCRRFCWIRPCCLAGSQAPAMSQPHEQYRPLGRHCSRRFVIAVSLGTWAGGVAGVGCQVHQGLGPIEGVKQC